MSRKAFVDRGAGFIGAAQERKRESPQHLDFGMIRKCLSKNSQFCRRLFPLSSANEKRRVAQAGLLLFRVEVQNLAIDGDGSIVIELLFDQFGLQ